VPGPKNIPKSEIRAINEQVLLMAMK